jgi:hypothetical protein
MMLLHPRVSASVNNVSQEEDMKKGTAKLQTNRKVQTNACFNNVIVDRRLSIVVSLVACYPVLEQTAVVCDGAPLLMYIIMYNVATSTNNTNREVNTLASTS